MDLRGVKPQRLPVLPRRVLDQAPRARAVALSTPAEEEDRASGDGEQHRKRVQDVRIGVAFWTWSWAWTWAGTWTWTGAVLPVRRYRWCCGVQGNEEAGGRGGAARARRWDKIG